MTDRRPRLRVAVLISGSGTNLQAFIDQVQSGRLDVELVVVISNRADAFGLERALRAGIPAECVRHTDYPDRESFEAALTECLERYRPDLILLAGFMRILTPAFVSRYPGRILNIHPSLLPRYPGLDTHRRVLHAGDPWHGSTVHFVTAELDGGPRIIQGRVRVMPGDDASSLAARVLAVEHRIYPEALRLIAAGRLRYDRGAAWFDDKRLDRPLQLEALEVPADAPHPADH